MKTHLFTFGLGLITLMALGVPQAALWACPTHDKAQAAEAKNSSSSFEGILQTGLMAIGGESTGYGIITSQGMIELSFEERPELVKDLEKWNGQRVKVKGRMTTVRGVEIPERKIIIVHSIMSKE